MKEFVAASDNEKKVVYSKIEEEVEKLEDSVARYFMGIWLFECHVLTYHLTIGLLKH